MRSPRFLVHLLVCALAACGCDRTHSDDIPPPPVDDCPLVLPEDYLTAVKCDAHKSCVFQCGAPCAEPERPFECPSLRPWAAIPHAPTCGNFDGATFPTPIAGKCTATLPTADAAQYVGKDTLVAGRFHIGDGYFVEPAGHDQILHGKGVASAFLADLLLVPGTSFAVVTDAGVDDNALYVVDLDKLAADQPALVSTLPFPRPSQLDYGLAFVAPNHVYVSGAANGAVFGFTVDTLTGTLTADKASDLDMGKSTSGRTQWYVGGIAPTPDATKLVVAPATGESQVRIVDRATKSITPIDVAPSTDFFGIFPDPNDATGNTVWLTSYDTRQLLRINLASAKVTSKIAVGKNPEGVALLGPTLVAVANSDSDTIDVVDTVGEKIVQTLKLRDDGLTGSQPSVMEVDTSRKRLYVALSGVNAIGVYDVDTSASFPLVPRGFFPTGWFPTAMRLRGDGSLVIAAAKGHGIGAVGNGVETPEATEGSIQLVAPLSALDLVTSSALVAASRSKTKDTGYPTVECGGAPYDFPVPLTNTGAPSDKIQHVLYVVRENKTFDALFGDMPVVNGDPGSVMSPGKMDEYWQNARLVAKTFTNFDNYYIAAEQSLQGHVWTSFGRSTDWVERTWSSTWGRGVRLPRAGIDRNYGSPAEGSLFLWSEQYKIPYDNMGEIVGSGDQGFDVNYPGLFYSQQVPDTEKACYIGARLRNMCDLKAFTYVVLPNDHTKGTDPGSPTPELMIAVNDVGTGMILDALSHSPLWASTLLIVTEDDPQNGADHVSGHRTPLFMASPWIKRGYVDRTNLSASALHKLIANILAKPYRSEAVANAPVPFDAFTSTPDFTPYTYKPLRTTVSCNPAKDIFHPEWDFSAPDNQTGLREDVDAHMRALGKPKAPQSTLEDRTSKALFRK